MVDDGFYADIRQFSVIWPASQGSVRNEYDQPSELATDK